MSPYSAYLRVYEPLVAFREPARAAWALYSDPDAELPEPRDVLAGEAVEMRAQLAATPPVLIPERESDQALVRRIDQATYICPLETRLRSVDAYRTLADVLPVEVLDAAIPEESRATADQRMERASSAEHSHIRQARWHVPMAWFVLFRQSERRLVLVPEEPASAAVDSDATTGEEPAAATYEPGGDRTLSYLTRMVEARRRLARGLAVLRKTVEGALVEEVELLGRWLEEFHPHALVELDYAGLVDLVDDGFLLTDRSVEDVAEGLSALSDGDGDEAARHYQTFVNRWARVERQENAN